MNLLYLDEEFSEIDWSWTLDENTLKLRSEYYEKHNIDFSNSDQKLCEHYKQIGRAWIVRRLKRGISEYKKLVETVEKFNKENDTEYEFYFNGLVYSITIFNKIKDKETTIKLAQKINDLGYFKHSVWNEVCIEIGISDELWVKTEE